MGLRHLLAVLITALVAAAPAGAAGPTAVAIGPDGRVSAGWVDGRTRAPVVARAGQVVPLPVPDGTAGASFVGDGLFAGPAGTRAVWAANLRDLATPGLEPAQTLLTGVPGGPVEVLARGRIGIADAAGDAAGRTLVAWDGASPGSAWVDPDGRVQASGAPPLVEPTVAVRDGRAAIAGQPCATGCDVEVWTTDGSAWTRAAVLPDTGGRPTDFGAILGSPWRGVALGDGGRVVVVTPSVPDALGRRRRLVFVRPAGEPGFRPAQEVGAAGSGAGVAEAGFVAYPDVPRAGLAAVAPDGTAAAPVPIAEDVSGPVTTAATPDGRGVIGALAGQRPQLVPVTADGTQGTAIPLGDSASGAPSVTVAEDGATAAAWVAEGGLRQSIRLATSGLPAEPSLATVGETGIVSIDPVAGAAALPDSRPAVDVPGRRVARAGRRVRVPVACRDFCRGEATIVAGASRTAVPVALQNGAGALLTARAPLRARSVRVALRVITGGRVVRRTVRRRIAPRGSRGPCDTPPWTGTLLRRGGTRVLVTAYGDAWENGERTVSACRAGRRRTFARAYSGFDVRGAVVAAAVRGSRVAVVTTQTSGRYGYTSSATLSTLDLATGARRSRQLTSDTGPPFGRATVRIALGADGTVAYLDRVGVVDRVRVLVVAPDGTERVLDAGAGIDPGRLAIDRGSVRWSRTGVERSAAVTG